MTDQDVRAFLERMADEEPIPFVDRDMVDAEAS